MEENGIMIVTVVISLAIVYILLFFLFPNLTIDWAFIPEKAFSGEWWRLFTYQFVHLNELHLFENVVSLAILGLIAAELNAKWDELSIIYIVSGILAIFPVFIISQFTALGASTAIYGGFGFLSQELEQFKIKPIYILLGLTFLIFFRGILSLIDCGFCDNSIFLLRQAGAHFSGLLIGVGFYKAIYINIHKSFLKGWIYGKISETD